MDDQYLQIEQEDVDQDLMEEHCSTPHVTDNLRTNIGKTLGILSEYLLIRGVGFQNISEHKRTYI
jgi:hypothetical protein